MKDLIKIYVKAGNGGNGCISFRHERYARFGGPNGGDGGNGGNVIIEVSSSVSDLTQFIYKSQFKAECGGHGKGNNQHGKNGKDIIIKVPCGTFIKEEENLIYDLIKDGEKILVANSGKGGYGNAKFATSIHQAPRIAQKGKLGEEKILILELKLIADIGLVGFPNVGKSTLLATISSAKPKIANYPFTTLTPVLGTVKIRKGTSFTVADIPGLIDNAHLGQGLGLQFLRHIERTKVLVYLLDLSCEFGKSPLSQFNILFNELKLYNPLLIKKPYLIVGNKIDLPMAQLTLKNLEKQIKPYPISALRKQGVKELIKKMYVLLEK